MLTEKQHHQAAKNEYNFDHPDAFDFELLRKTLQRLKLFKSVEVPIYNFITHSREAKSVCVFVFFMQLNTNLISFFFRKKTMYGANVIIFEGILTFYNQDICSVSRKPLFFMLSNPNV